MPVYEDEKNDYAHLEHLRKTQVCAECGGRLTMFMDARTDPMKAYLVCNDYNRTHHEGIAKQAKYFEENIEARGERLETELGKDKAVALRDAANVTVMTNSVATQIIETLWGEAPAIEKTKAIMMCQQYNLNPLMKHLHLVKYNRWNKERTKIIGEDWSIMIGIQATRLMSHRNHKFTYMDMTPRIATKEEIDKILGDTARDDMLYGFTHIKDLETGAESWGLKGCLKKEKIKGEEKGNTVLNMACIRSERQAIDREYPNELPVAEVFDERFVEVQDVGPVDVTTGEILDGEVIEGSTLKDLAEAQEGFPVTASELLGLEEEPKDTDGPITQENFADMKVAMDSYSITLGDIGAYCNKTRQWGIKDLKDLKVSQFKELMAAIPILKK